MKHLFFQPAAPLTLLSSYINDDGSIDHTSLPVIGIRASWGLYDITDNEDMTYDPIVFDPCEGYIAGKRELEKGASARQAYFLAHADNENEIQNGKEINAYALKRRVAKIEKECSHSPSNKA